MSEISPDFEEIDVAGSTYHFNGSVGTTGVSIPSSPDKVISEFCIANVDSVKNSKLYVSLDGGTTFKAVGFNSEWSWSPKGQLKQIKVKSDSGSPTRSYEIVMNFEVF